MDVHIGRCLLDCAQQVAVVIRLKVARQPSLHAHLARSHLPGFDGAALDLFERMKVCVMLARRSAECAEAAADEAYVCEIDIAVDYVSNHIADALATDA